MAARTKLRSASGRGLSAEWCRLFTVDAVSLILSLSLMADSHSNLSCWQRLFKYKKHVLLNLVFLVSSIVLHSLYRIYVLGM